MYSINLTARADLQVCGLLFVCLFVCLWVKVGCGHTLKEYRVLASYIASPLQLNPHLHMVSTPVTR